MTTPTITTRVECDHCGLKVRLRKDGTVPPHEYTSYRENWRGGVVPGSRKRQRCEHSEKRYAFHMGTFFVVTRNARGIGTSWRARCRCGEFWDEPTYDAVELKWVEHCRAIENTDIPTAPTEEN